MFIGMCQIDFRDASLQSMPESTVAACVCVLFSPEDNAMFISAPFSKRSIWFFNAALSLEVPSIPTVSGSFLSFFQILNPVARCLSEVEKFFSSPKFLPSSLFNWQDEYLWDKA